jgi:DNA-binding beta-propeller fold protein YncE
MSGHTSINMGRLACTLAVGVLLSTPAAVPAAEHAGPYRVLAQWPIGGTDTGYDYLRVDADARRVYVAHGTRVEVLDVDSGQRLGEITGMHGVHGIEVIAELGRGYTSNGVERTVTVFDRATLAIRKVIAYTGVKPDAIQYDAGSKLLFVVNGGSTGDVTVIDPTTDAIVATVELGGSKLEQIGFDGSGRAFVNDEGKNVIHVFDTQTLRKTATWPLGACEEPTGMAVDREHGRIFSACGNEKLAVLDSTTGAIVAMAPIGKDPDGAAFDARTRRVFTSNRDGTLSILQEVTPGEIRPLQTLKTAPGARTIALDAKTGRVVMPSAQTGAAPTGGGSPSIEPKSFKIVVAGE